MADISALLQRALACHQAGDLKSALPLYLQVLRDDPYQPDALHLLGLVKLRLGDAKRGTALMRAAIALMPHVPDWYCNLGHGVAALSDIDAAIHHYMTALSLRSDMHNARLALYQTMAASIRADERFSGDRAARATVAARRPDAPMISVVVCSIDPVKFARVSANYGAVLRGTPFEIVGIHDAKSLCDGYARGFAGTRGDIIVFSHDDVEILNDDFADRLLEHMREVDLLGVAGTDRLAGPSWFTAGWPHQFGQVAMRRPSSEGEWRTEIFGMTPGRNHTGGIQALDGLFLACRRPLVESLGWDAETFNGFHLYDIDFSWRAALAGARVAVAHDIWLLHESTGNMDAAWREQAARFLTKHAATVTQRPQGPNPGRFAQLATRDQIRGHLAAQRALAEGTDWRQAALAAVIPH